LYDEPTTGLDPINTARINHLIIAIQRTLKLTSVVVTHDMGTAFAVSDRLASNAGAALKPGAPVRMGGLDVGQVTGLHHGSDPKDGRIFVTLAVEKKESLRIRTDSVAHVGNKGLLGDKMIELGLGSPDALPIDPNQLIPSEEPADMFAAANRVAAAAQKAIEKLEPLAP